MVQSHLELQWTSTEFVFFLSLVARCSFASSSFLFLVVVSPASSMCPASSDSSAPLLTVYDYIDNKCTVTPHQIDKAYFSSWMAGRFFGYCEPLTGGYQQTSQVRAVSVTQPFLSVHRECLPSYVLFLFVCLFFCFVLFLPRCVCISSSLIRVLNGEMAPPAAKLLFACALIRMSVVRQLCHVESSTHQPVLVYP